MYQFKWSKRNDAAHTITLHGVDSDAEAWRIAEGFVRQMRVGVPWKLANDGETIAYGFGTEAVTGATL